MVLNQPENTFDFFYSLGSFVFLPGYISGPCAGPVYKGRLSVVNRHVILHGHKRTAKIGEKLVVRSCKTEAIFLLRKSENK